MIYMIVCWNGTSYDILHYSHDFEDATRVYEIRKAQFSEAQLLVDVRVLHVHEMQVKTQEFRKLLAERNKSK